MAELPCDADGRCMVCKLIPSDAQVILCNSCSSPWHMDCLHPPMASVPSGDWFCPDCEPSPSAAVAVSTVTQTPLEAQTSSSSSSIAVKSGACGGDGADIVTQVRAIRADPNLSEQEKARRCQDVMSKKGTTNGNGLKQEKKIHKMLQIFDENLNCIFCMQLADRPVTTPCGHNFCLKCFQRWVAQGKKECGKCRTPIPAKMASQPRINAALVVAIRMAKSSTSPSVNGPSKPYHYIQNQDRPDKCFTTERAKKAGKANASSGKIFVTVPPDHFGPITAENDPERNQGVLVGETWEDRMECRQWGAHLPHVAGIAGQSEHGAQSVALSGGYEDDEDHGEWFLYTGSGGRDLSGNKRTNDKQSFDQKFEKSNLALKVSCKRGYPVRVVRSHKEKRSSYAPETGVRYDGIYRIEKCWRKKGIQGFKVCRYLFVRCDNEPAPWTSDEIGDRPRPLPEISELEDAVDITERKSQTSWDWKEDEGVWGWVTTPPNSRKIDDGTTGSRGGTRKSLTMGQRLLKEFGCGLCKKVLTLPLSTPCGHNFCKSCLLSTFSGQKDIRERTGVGGRSLRAQKIVKRCPLCQGDISDLLSNPQVNRQMEDLIQSLKEDDSDTDNKDTDTDKDVYPLQQDEGEVDTNEDASTSANSNGCASSHQPENISNTSVNGNGHTSSNGHGKMLNENCVSTKVKIDTAKEEAFLKVCARFPMYSEELLRSMLADQDGDVRELESMLKALQKQDKQKPKQKAVGKEQEVSNGCSSSEEKVGELDEEMQKQDEKKIKPRKASNGCYTSEEEKIEELNDNVHKEKEKTRQVSNGCKTLEDRIEVPDNGLTMDERKKTKQEACNGTTSSEEGNIDELAEGLLSNGQMKRVPLSSNGCNISEEELDSGIQTENKKKTKQKAINSCTASDENKLKDLTEGLQKNGKTKRAQQASNGCNDLEQGSIGEMGGGVKKEELKKTKQEANNGCNTSEDGVEVLTDVFQKLRGKRNRKESADVPTPLRQSKRKKV